MYFHSLNVNYQCNNLIIYLYINDSSFFDSHIFVKFILIHSNLIYYFIFYFSNFHLKHISILFNDIFKF
jgi:hypothetical protein